MQNMLSSSFLTAFKVLGAWRCAFFLAREGGARRGEAARALRGGGAAAGAPASRRGPLRVHGPRFAV